MTDVQLSPAGIAAAEAQAEVDACLDGGRSFRLEAGAGAGKTYSLVQALKRLIAQRGTKLLHEGQKVACITYTEVARDEIAQEIEQHPAIRVDTIHAFSWAFLSQFQKSLRGLVEAMEDRQDKIVEGGGVPVNCCNLPKKRGLRKKGRSNDRILRGQARANVQRLCRAKIRRDVQDSR